MTDTSYANTGATTENQRVADQRNADQQTQQARDAGAQRIAAEKKLADKPAEPKSAKEVLDRVDEDHNYTHDPINMGTTGGVQKAIERNWRGLQALARYIDGR